MAALREDIHGGAWLSPVLACHFMLRIMFTSYQRVFVANVRLLPMPLQHRRCSTGISRQQYKGSSPN